VKFSATCDTRALEQAIDQATRSLLEGLEDGVGAAAHALRDEAKRNAPVGETGKLRDGIGAHVTGLQAEVAVFDRKVTYATFVEHGTSKQPAQPFMLPAAEVERRRFVKRLVKAVEKRL
jgi:HK97 gp10 family phage protein